MQRFYDINVDKLPSGEGFEISIGPAGRSGVLAIKGPLDRQAVLSLLLEHAHFSERSAISLMDKVERDDDVTLLQQGLSNEEAAAFGWVK